MACPNCEDGCAPDNECDCECHNDNTATVFENQSIEFEKDSHLPDGTVINKIRVVVTGRDYEEAYEQFERVMVKIQ
jgi:hypothetical protein